MTCLIFCDNDFRIQHATAIPDPFTAKDWTGSWLWAHVTGDDVDKLRAAFAIVACEHRPMTVDVRLRGAGLWRLVIEPVPLTAIRYVITAREVPPLVLKLPARHRELCRLLAEGLSQKQVALRMDISLGTLHNHRAKIAERIKRPTAAVDVWCGQVAEFL